MCRMRCEICRKRLPTYQRLIGHCVNEHSKSQLARELFKLSMKNVMPKVLGKKIRNNAQHQARNSDTQNTDKFETVFSNDSVQILYQNNDIIIRDDKSSIDMEFSFDENSDDVKDDNILTKKIFGKKLVAQQQDIINNNGKEQKQNKKATIITMGNVAHLKSSSSTSSEDSLKKFAFKQKIRKKRDTRDKARHYKVNITRLKNCGFLDDITGRFYQCHCKGTAKEIFDDTKIKSESDTESASETAVGYSNDPKVFCSKCGNGYKEDSLLLEHMKVHEKHCRVCNEIFQTDAAFKVHIQSHTFEVFVCHLCSYEFPSKQMLERHFESHLEQCILESVLDMEEDYKIRQCPVPNIPYQTCINSIINYLGKTNGPKYKSFNNSRSSVNCAICFVEISKCDFQSHMQNVHRIYGYN